MRITFNFIFFAFTTSLNWFGSQFWHKKIVERRRVDLKEKVSENYEVRVVKS
jgi:hypothetical protein